MVVEEHPLITIGMPVKNRRWCLERVLKALENIDYPKHKLKVVFVDDYSRDGSYELLIKWSIKAKALGFYKVEVIRAKTNIPQARNLCVKHMEGKYLLFWDSDVISPPELLREIIDIMEHNPDIGMIGADYMYEPETGIKYKPTISKETHAVYMGFTLIRRDVFEKVGGFNENLSVGEDTEFCIRVKEKTGYRILWAPKPVLHLKKSKNIEKPSLLWIKYNFQMRAKEYYASWKSLPKFLKFRIFYWLLWPWSIIALIYLLFEDRILFVIPILAYISSSIYLTIKQKGLTQGIIHWIKGNMPTGLALSYGIAKEFIAIIINKLIVRLKAGK